MSVKIPGTKRVDHNRAVKMYERAAGDKTIPSDLRPPIVLKVLRRLFLLHFLLNHLSEHWTIYSTTSYFEVASRLPVALFAIVPVL